ncbi:DUF3095 domain-containing protein [Neorhizobium sp. P12A]|uniref:DUF3095 domain-containing protein n=1 Tax=Neorhizobium sp. P12A TaxID=2268027 RepID=UPI0011EE6A4B|nr:DUF3095 domain-containing protein [Neorhizobium sp. P12A]KAA0686878.1 DUF3095 domain-containing protein [Neorhizobium sp. P12A]
MNKMSSDAFFAGLPVFTDFERVTDESNYQPLPEGWVLATADIVGSTQAIVDGRYKDVNMAGVSVISAVLNAVGKGDYPFVFAGDGAVIALPGSLEKVAREALAATHVWVKEELDLDLRIAVVPIGDIRAAGLDVRVARYSASPFVTYAMFSGGGTSWAEKAMKMGRFGVEKAAPGACPDLNGLSCRWRPMEARNGEIVSIIAVPGDAGLGAEFQALVAAVVSIAAERNRNGHPAPEDGPTFAFSMKAVSLEAAAAAPKGRRLREKLFIFLQIGLAVFLNTFGITFGQFDARRFRKDVARNSDFRKFDDGLKMTVDIDAARVARIEALLKQAQDEGVVRYGLHRQSSALMTCFVPSPLSRDHIHFIDGAAGGYAVAASQIAGKQAVGTRCALADVNRQ